MKEIRILVVMGTRPEAIKLCPVIERLRTEAALIRTHVVLTHQHEQMLDQVLEVFGVTPDFDLALMSHNQSLNQVAAKLLSRIDPILRKVRPDLVLVQGDTVTACVAGLACFYSRIRVGHVEAGLRTGDYTRPYPEEMNRRLLGPLASVHFAPTLSAVENLQREGIPADRIHLTGNTVVDALHMILAKDRHAASLDHFGRERRLLLVTAHRRENFGPPLRGICKAIKILSERNPDIEVVYPVHLNPNVRKVVYGSLEGRPRVHLIEPVNYLDFAYLMNRSTLILTDSGGVQEEAPSLGKPVLVLRDKTERPEVIESGVGELVGTDPTRIVVQAQQLLDDPVKYRQRAKIANPFGDGRASERIVKIILQHLSSDN